LISFFLLTSFSSSSGIGDLPRLPPDLASLVYDFSAIDRDLEDDSPTLWDLYTKLCYAQQPPIPALSLMRPILFGDQNSAFFAHQHIGKHVNIILEMLTRSKVVSEIDFSDNSLTGDCITPLIDFVNEADQLSLLHIDDNPEIGAHAVRELLEGIKECRSLESLSLANTGSNASIGRSIGQILNGCGGLLRLNVNSCCLRQAGLDVAQALPNSSTLKRLSIAKNELFYGQRRFALQFGANAARTSTLSRIDLSQNVISSDMAIALLRGLGDATALHRLDLSKNEIGEPAARAIAGFITKSSCIRRLDISQNPVLNVTANKLMGQKKLEEEGGKSGGDKKEKPKVYVPGGYTIIAALAKSTSIKEMRMIGLVANPIEWQQKLDLLGEGVSVVYRVADSESFNFRPQTAMPLTKTPLGGRAQGASSATGRKK
jgi:Ran GTPase-activating protein (RanGAP) involved in mRNA processing and transport